MKGVRLCGARAAVFPLAVCSALRTSRRWATQRDMVTVETTSGDFNGERVSAPPTVDFARAAEEEEVFSGEFDELEAAAQEIHDLCYAMIAHLRKADPDGTKDLFERRIARRFREPVPQSKRRLLHDHGNRTLFRQNSYTSKKELDDATHIFLQFGEKLMLLLTKPALDRIIESAGKPFRDQRADGVHRYKLPLERASWRNFPHRWYKHAPYEVQQLRADMPEVTVKNTRAMRDISTLRSLFTLMEPQHPFRAGIESRIFAITQEYDPVQKSNPSSR